MRLKFVSFHTELQGFSALHSSGPDNAPPLLENSTLPSIVLPPQSSVLRHEPGYQSRLSLLLHWKVLLVILPHGPVTHFRSRGQHQFQIIVDFNLLFRDLEFSIFLFGRFTLFGGLLRTSGWVTFGVVKILRIPEQRLLRRISCSGTCPPCAVVHSPPN